MNPIADNNNYSSQLKTLFIQSSLIPVFLLLALFSVFFSSCNIKIDDDSKKNAAPPPPSASIETIKPTETAKIEKSSEEKNIESEKKSNSPNEAKELNEDNISLNLEEKNQANLFNIKIQWPKVSGWIRIQDSSGQLLFFLNANSHNVFIHENQKGGSQLVYDFQWTDDSGKLLKTIKKSLQTPKDYEFSGFLSLSEPLTLKDYHRVFLSKAAIIQTNGKAFSILTEKLISAQGARIFTFAQGSQAPYDQNGKHGGSIDIRVSKAFGDLQIELNGQNGGDGRDGQAWETRATDGAPGKNLTDGEACERDKMNGKPGNNGAKGRPGSNGGAGGNSGSLYVEIKEKSDFKLNYIQRVGLAGRPGEGGPSQQPGLGGLPGKSEDGACGQGSKGKDGQRLEKGEAGIRQSDGLFDKLCVLNGSEEIKGSCQ